MGAGKGRRLSTKQETGKFNKDKTMIVFDKKQPQTDREDHQGHRLTSHKPRCGPHEDGRLRRRDWPSFVGTLEAPHGALETNRYVTLNDLIPLKFGNFQNKVVPQLKYTH